MPFLFLFYNLNKLKNAFFNNKKIIFLNKTINLF